MLTADLHMHSQASDGCLTSTQIVEAALNAGLSCISITDHDAIGGVLEARDASQGTFLSVIPGVELSTEAFDHDVHLLGYFIDIDSCVLNSHFLNNRALREERACKIADNLANAGFPISSDEIRASGLTINRTLVARILVKKGIVSSIDNAFDTLIGRGTPYYVENVRLSTFDAIKLIREAGGYPFLAHPVPYGLVQYIPAFKDAGLHGIEVYHTMQTAEDSCMLKQIADDLQLAASGGSDWHGDDTHGASLAKAGLDQTGLDMFLASCERTRDDI